MKSTILRLTLATALALSGFTACSKKPDGTGSGQVEELKNGKKKKLKKDGSKKAKKVKKEKTPKDPLAPATPAPPAP